VLWRIETMAMMSDVDLPVAHVRTQVAGAIDVIVHMARLRDGRRVVFQISTVDGVDPAGDPIVTEIFGFRTRLGPEGAFVATGLVPQLAKTLAGRAQDVPAEWFDVDVCRDPGPHPVERS
jgi:pilus assembly protein CpaF